MHICGASAITRLAEPKRKKKCPFEQLRHTEYYCMQYEWNSTRPFLYSSLGVHMCDMQFVASFGPYDVSNIVDIVHSVHTVVHSSPNGSNGMRFLFQIQNTITIEYKL